MDARMSHLRRGWYWGAQAFGEKLRALIAPRMDKPRSRAYRRNPQRLAHGLARAEALVAEGLRIAGLQDQDLPRMRGGDPRKVALARLVRARTTASLEWWAW